MVKENSGKDCPIRRGRELTMFCYICYSAFSYLDDIPKILLQSTKVFEETTKKKELGKQLLEL